MKKILPALTIFYLLYVSCGTNKTESTDTKNRIDDTSSTTSEPGNNSSIPGSSDGLTGKWNLLLDAFDDNDNDILDPEERKKAVPNRTSYQFNADGTCRIMNMFNGRYKVQKEGTKNMLYVYREKVVGEETEDPLPDIFEIISVSKTELILLVMMAGESTTFWIFERVG